MSMRGFYWFLKISIGGHLMRILLRICLLFLLVFGCKFHEKFYKLKLTPINDREQNVTFTVPNGCAFRLLLCSPKEEARPFRGSLQIYEATKLIYSKVIDSKKLMRAGTWCSGFNMGWILTSSGKKLNELDSVVKQGRTYRLRVNWEQMPPSGSVIELTWIR